VFVTESEMDNELREERLVALEERRFTSTQLQISSVTDLGDTVASIFEGGPGSGFLTMFVLTEKVNA
jgi:hypothetical protein